MADLRDDRDRQMDQILRRTAVAPASSPCVDAEQLAAWSARTLPANEAAKVEDHLADCADCQAMLAAFTASEPPVVARSPWRLRWLVPISAASAAMLVWAVATRDPGEVPPPESTTARAEPQTSDRAFRESERPAAPPAGAAEEFGAASQQLAQPPPAREGAAVAAERLERADDSLARGLGQARAAEPAQAFDAAKATSSEAVAGRDASPVQPAARAPAAPAATEALPVSNAPAAASAPVRAAPGERQFQARSSLAAGGNVLMDSASALSPVVPLHGRASGSDPVVFGPAADPAGRQLERWRIGSDGRVEQSTDGGQLWEAVVLASSVFVTAGSAPVSGVCWLVGQDGVVLRLADGAAFERRTSPAEVALVGVEATDAAGAVVTAADGRRFVTDDGGSAWRLVNP